MQSIGYENIIRYMDKGYSMSLKKVNDKFTIEIGLLFDPVLYFREFTLETLQKEEKSWNLISNEVEFKNFIKVRIEKSELQLIFSGDGQGLTLILLLDCQLEEMKKFSIILKKIEKSEYDTIKQMSLGLRQLVEKINIREGETIKEDFIDQGNGVFQFSNNNKTVKRIGGANGSWCGLKGRKLEKLKTTFSFKLSEFNPSTGTSAIFVGYCTTATDLNNGLSTKNTAFMINLLNGYIYNRTTAKAPRVGWQGTVRGDVISCMIDLKNKFMMIFINGIQTSFPSKIDVKDEEINSLHPCIDFQYHGEVITFVEYDELALI